MGQLQTLSGEPLTWLELHDRNEEWWETHELDGSLKVEPIYRSAYCKFGLRSQQHEICQGGRRSQPCQCVCHGIERGGQ